MGHETCVESSHVREKVMKRSSEAQFPGFLWPLDLRFLGSEGKRRFKAFKASSPVVHTFYTQAHALHYTQHPPSINYHVIDSSRFINQSCRSSFGPQGAA